MKVKATFLAAAALLGSLATAQPAISSEQVMVKVNGQPILGRQFYPRMAVLPDFGRLVRDQFVPASPGFLTLQQLINEHLTVQLAREQGIYPTDQELEAEIQRRKEDSPQLLNVFTTLGLTEAEYRWDTLVNLCQFRIITRGVNIADMEVEQAYNANIATRYTLPRRYTLRVISVLTPDDQKKVDEALAKGTPFADVVRDYSQDEAKISGGLLGELADSQVGGQLKDAISPLKKGGFTAWIAVGKAWSKFWLEDLKEKEVIPLNDGLRRQIRRDLMIERGQARNNFPKMMEDMRAKVQLEFSGTPFDAALKTVFGPKTSG